MCDSNIEAIKTLLDHRTLIFNTRRQYEWKIFFGVTTILVLSNSFIITKQVQLNSKLSIVLWALFVVSFLLAAFIFEFELQRRNKTDRIIINRLLRLLNEELDSSKEDLFFHGIELPIEIHSEGLETTYSLWAFFPKLMVLGPLGAISIGFPIFMS